MALILSLFELSHAILYQAPAITRPEEIVAIYGRDKLHPYLTTSWPNYIAMRSKQTAFSSVAAYVRVQSTLREESGPRSVWGEMVSANYFLTLGVQPALGRLIGESDDGACAPVIVVSYEFWERRFGRNPKALGTSLWLNHHAFSIVGIAPLHFEGIALDWGDTPQFWVTSCQQPQIMSGSSALLTNRNAPIAVILGRLVPGMTFNRASANLQMVAKLLDRDPQDPSFTFVALHLNRARFWPAFRDPIGHKLQTLFLLGVCVLFIACANVATLLLARSSVRQPEIALRFVLGAGRLRLIRQLVVESLLISLMGGVAGLALVWSSLRATEQLNQLFPIPLHVHLHPTFAAVLLCTLISLTAGMLFGIAPALLLTRSRNALSMANRSFTSSRNRTIWLRCGVVVEIAICAAVAFTTMLLGRSVWKQTFADRGLQPEGVTCADFSLPRNRYPAGSEPLVYRQVLDRLGVIPGVQGVALSAESLGPPEIVRALADSIDPKPVETIVTSVSSQYFEVLKIGFLSGKLSFGDQAAEKTSPDGVIVSRSLAQRLWGGNDPIGKFLVLDGSSSPQPVIAVVADVLDGDTQAPKPHLYRSVFRNPAAVVTLDVRSNLPANAVFSSMRLAISQSDQDLMLDNLETLRSRIDRQNRQTVTLSIFIAIFAGISLLLTFVGTLSLAAYEGAQQRRATGIRLALGETRAGVTKFFLRRAMVVYITGLVVSVPLSVLLSSLFRAWYWRTTQLDGVAITAVISLLGAAIFLASLVPALRSAALNPIDLLREE
jgi:predicted permease